MSVWLLATSHVGEFFCQRVVISGWTAPSYNSPKFAKSDILSYYKENEDKLHHHLTDRSHIQVLSGEIQPNAKGLVASFPHFYISCPKNWTKENDDNIFSCSHTVELVKGKKKVKADIALPGGIPISELRDVTCHIVLPATRHELTRPA